MNTGKVIKIGILDIFGKNKGIPVNGVKPDFSHGEMTSSVLKCLTDEFNRSITKIPVTPRENSGNMSFDLLSLLKKLKEINKIGKDFDFLNISGSFPVPYALFGLEKDGAELASKEVQKEVLTQMKKVIKTDSNYEMRLVPEEVVQILSELNRIIKGGTEVFISACNKSLSFNSFSLAKGIHTIGGKNAKTNLPINRFSHSPLVEEYVNLPIYITNSKELVQQNDINVIHLGKNIKIDSEIAKIPKEQLQFANQNDYKVINNVSSDLFLRRKFVFDLDFLRFKFVNAVTKYNEAGAKIVNKIFETEKFMEIFKNKFDSEVLKYTNPQGSTHCDIMFRQFFNMNNKSNHVIPLEQTTQITNTLSGTSFAAPQGLTNFIKRNVDKK